MTTSRLRFALRVFQFEDNDAAPIKKRFVVGEKIRSSFVFV